MPINQKQINEDPIVIKSSATAPAEESGKAKLFSKLINSISELFVKDSAGNEIQVTDNGSVRLPTVPSLVPTGGVADSVLAKESNADHVMGWKKNHQLNKDFWFVLPKAADLGARLLTAGTISGLELYTAAGDPTADAQLGSSAKTLVLVPSGLTNFVVAEIMVQELTEVGTDLEQGWKSLVDFGVHKTNTSKTKMGILNFADYLDISKDVLIYVRFLKVDEMQSFS